MGRKKKKGPPLDLPNKLNSSPTKKPNEHSEKVNSVLALHKQKENSVEKEVLINSTSVNFSSNSHNECTPILETPTKGTIWNGYVTDLNSIKYFFVQHANNLTYVESTLCSILESIECSSKLIIPKVGDIVAARYKDGFWYRAKVKKVNAVELKVCFIDYGNKDERITEFKRLPIDLIQMKPLAHRCSFKNIPKGDEDILSNSNFSSILDQFFATNKVTVNFLNFNEPYIVTLWLNGRNVYDIITDFIWNGIVPGTVPDSIEIEKQKLIHKMSNYNRLEVACIKPIISTERFFVTTKYCEKLSKKIITEIKNEKNWVSVLEPEVGQIVVARCSQNNELFRARLVMSYPDSEIYKCFLIDHGTFEDCSQLYVPSNSLCSIPPVKIHCSLNVKYSDNSLQKTINVAFIDEINTLLKNKKIIQIKVIEVCSPCIVDLRVKNLSISQVIEPCKVKIVHITDTNSFIARLDSAEFCNVLNVLKNKSKLNKALNPVLLDLYVAKFDDQYKRVKLVGRSEERFEVVRVDEYDRKGGKSMQYVADLYQLPKSIENALTIDVDCSLDLRSNTTLSVSRNKFIEICDYGKATFTMVVTKNDYENGHLVKLFTNSKDILTLICD